MLCSYSIAVSFHFWTATKMLDNVHRSQRTVSYVLTSWRKSKWIMIFSALLSFLSVVMLMTEFVNDCYRTWVIFSLNLYKVKGLSREETHLPQMAKAMPGQPCTASVKTRGHPGSSGDWPHLHSPNAFKRSNKNMHRGTDQKAYFRRNFSRLLGSSVLLTGKTCLYTQLIPKWLPCWVPGNQLQTYIENACLFVFLYH